jgi:hypothetical protein
VAIDVAILSIEVLALATGAASRGSSTKAGVKLGRLLRFTKGLRGMRMLRSGIRGARLLRECRTSTLKLLDRWRRYMRPTKRGVTGSLRESLRALDEVDSWAGRVSDLGQNIKRELDRSTSMVIAEVKTASEQQQGTNNGQPPLLQTPVNPKRGFLFNSELPKEVTAHLQHTEAALTSLASENARLRAALAEHMSPRDTSPRREAGGRITPPPRRPAPRHKSQFVKRDDGEAAPGL